MFAADLGRDRKILTKTTKNLKKLLQDAMKCMDQISCEDVQCRWREKLGEKAALVKVCSATLIC